MNKLITGAVATAMVAPVAAFAAIDDQGMQYVSAGEGLKGSFRMDLLIDTDKEDDDVSSNVDSLRLYLSGDIDLGGGMKSTYYYETRDKGGGGLETEAYDIGLTGPFGSVAFGHLGMVAPRMVPGADLMSVRGPNRKSFASDPGAHGIRYESPVINGFQFGASAILDGSDPGDPLPTNTNINDSGLEGSLDEFSLAVKYTLPVGLQLGAGYESKDVALPDGTYAVVGLFGGGDAITVGSTEVGNLPGTADLMFDVESMTGFRFGARYGQDNWMVAYEYRGYEGYAFSEADAFTGGTPVVVSSGGVDVTLGVYEEIEPTLLGFPGVEYVVHAVGAQAKIDRLTLSAGYSMEELTDEEFVYTGGESKAERDTITVDASYSMGSKSRITLGYKSEDYTIVENPFGFAAASYRNENDVSTTFLNYRVDF